MSKEQTQFGKLIGHWRYSSKKFIYEKQVLIKQTNVIGNTYFANYIEWEGEAREKFFLAHPAAPEFLKSNPNILLVTHSLFHRFVENTFFGDRVRVELTCKEILDYSVAIIFRHFELGKNLLEGEGWQKLCFFDNVTNRPCRIPQIFVDLAKSVEEEKGSKLPESK